MTDVFDLCRLLRERVAAAGLGLLRMTWTPRDGVRVSLAIPGTDEAWSVWFDEDFGEAIDLAGGETVAQIVDAEIARARRVAESRQRLGELERRDPTFSTFAQSVRKAAVGRRLTAAAKRGAP